VSARSRYSRAGKRLRLAGTDVRKFPERETKTTAGHSSAGIKSRVSAISSSERFAGRTTARVEEGIKYRKRCRIRLQCGKDNSVQEKTRRGTPGGER
jgi:hypothetical protein